MMMMMMMNYTGFLGTPLSGPTIIPFWLDLKGWDVAEILFDAEGIEWG